MKMALQNEYDYDAYPHDDANVDDIRNHVCENDDVDLGIKVVMN